MMDIVSMWTAFRMPAGAVLCLLGGVLCLIGAIGIIRFPDIYTRLHAASVIDTGGAFLVIAGLALMAPSPQVFLELAAIFVFLVLTGPAASHALAHAAHVAGIQPLIGRIGEGALHEPEEKG